MRGLLKVEADGRRLPPHTSGSLRVRLGSRAATLRRARRINDGIMRTQIEKQTLVMKKAGPFNVPDDRA